jgi:hypothetical protein
MSAIHPSDCCNATPSELSTLSESILTSQIKESWQVCKRLDDEFMAELRRRLIPLIDEAFKRLDKDGEVNGKKTREEFCESVGVNYSTYRSWKMRAAQKHEQGEHEPNPPARDEDQLTVEKVISASKKLMTDVNTIKKAALTDAERAELARELKTRGTRLTNLSEELSKQAEVKPAEQAELVGV